MKSEQTTALNLLDDLLARAKKAGAEAADAVYVSSASLSLSQRLGNPEHLERSESQDVGLRVFIGQQQAIVSTSDATPDTLDQLCARAVAMARAVPEDPYCGLAEPDQLATEFPDIEPFDS
ncbi:MAG: TldD/PmbA family protein, partial [Rhodospirillaceae bacterium]|nr:TldD/PmbA family protein [Rhodospirillaceae bacterium]